MIKPAPFPADLTIAGIAPTRENICAVIVTFHPDGGFPARVRRIASQVRQVVIVDNHSNESAISMLRQLSSQLNVRLLLNEDNLGVATALNQGVSEASQRGIAWALLLDQDTLPFASLVSTLGKAFGEYPEKRRIAVIGSNYLEAATRKPRFAHTGGESQSWLEQKTAITSGSLISVPVFEAIGRFRDELFIDEVDTEYCLRARARGFAVIIAREPVMRHEIGAALTRRFLWRTVRPTNHSALRWYYMTRNPLIVAQEYWQREPSWVLGNFYSRSKMMVKALLFESDKLRKARLMLRGGWHGLQGRLGRL